MKHETMNIQMKKVFSLALCLLLISLKSACACEMVQIPQSASHQAAENHEGCHGHEKQSSKTSHHACLCLDHQDQGVVSASSELNAPSISSADVAWVVIDFIPTELVSERFDYHHSPPSGPPLYITQASLLL